MSELSIGYTSALAGAAGADLDCHPAAIALGGNLGDSRSILTAAIAVLDQTPGITVTAQSPLYKTAPVGPPQPDYLNGCVTLSTVMTPQALLDRLLAIEAQFGRVRKERWGARSLDLDLLFYSDRVLDQVGLTLPHPRLHERAFVLVPLADIAPHWHHPILNQTVSQLLHQLCQAQPLDGSIRPDCSTLPVTP